MEMTAKEIADNIDLQVQVIINNIDFANSKVRVHQFSGDDKEDLARSAYVVFSLARAGTLNTQVLFQLSRLVEKLEKRILQDFSNQGIVALCYLLRYKKISGLNMEKNLEFLEQQDLQSIFAHPVSMYVFVSTVHELGLSESSYLSSIKNECLKNFEYLLFSGLVDSLPIFSLAEVNYWKDFLQLHFYQQSQKYLLSRLQVLDQDSIKKIASSGLGKCLEFLAFEKNEPAREITTKIFTELDTRSVEGPFKNMYFENWDSGYINLDTNVHLLHYYLNLKNSYAKNN
jgi:hypothetical protein